MDEDGQVKHFLKEHAYFMSESTCALIEAMGMQAENKQREHRGESMAYVEADFAKLLEKYQLGHNAVIGGFYRK